MNSYKRRLTDSDGSLQVWRASQLNNSVYNVEVAAEVLDVHIESGSSVGGEPRVNRVTVTCRHDLRPLSDHHHSAVPQTRAIARHLGSGIGKSPEPGYRGVRFERAFTSWFKSVSPLNRNLSPYVHWKAQAVPRGNRRNRRTQCHVIADPGNGTQSPPSSNRCKAKPCHCRHQCRCRVVRLCRTANFCWNTNLCRNLISARTLAMSLFWV